MIKLFSEIFAFILTLQIVNQYFRIMMELHVAQPSNLFEELALKIITFSFSLYYSFDILLYPELFYAICFLLGTLSGYLITILLMPWIKIPDSASHKQNPLKKLSLFKLCITSMFMLHKPSYIAKDFNAQSAYVTSNNNTSNKRRKLSPQRPKIDSKFYLKLAIYNNLPRFISRSKETL